MGEMRKQCRRQKHEEYWEEKSNNGRTGSRSPSGKEPQGWGRTQKRVRDWSRAPSASLPPLSSSKAQRSIFRLARMADPKHLFHRRMCHHQSPPQTDLHNDSCQRPLCSTTTSHVPATASRSKEVRLRAQGTGARKKQRRTMGGRTNTRPAGRRDATNIKGGMWDGRGEANSVTRMTNQAVQAFCHIRPERSASRFWRPKLCPSRER